jgi:hypothetical protein
MPLTLKATIKVKTAMPRDKLIARATHTIECETPQQLAGQGIHCLIQAVGTKAAREFVEKKLAEYLPGYGGLDAPVPPLAIAAETTP